MVPEFLTSMAGAPAGYFICTGHPIGPPARLGTPTTFRNRVSTRRICPISRPPFRALDSTRSDHFFRLHLPTRKLRGK
jgi:hypothetical protein